ncbi:MAG: hypothetical protein JXA37_08025 [Chloroflexia bacterium]|nr:hypothetical protein [Chloroflexia bacterium]
MEETVGLAIAAILTLMVYSFLIADNPLFRLAEHLLVGTALGYAVLVVLQRFLLPSISDVLATGGNPLSRLMTALGLLWGLLLWLWLARPVRWLASWPLAIVFGVGAALAIGGALMGTLIPQVGATMLPLSGNGWLDNLVIVIVVIAGLSYFFFIVRKEHPLGKIASGVAHFGRWCLMLALGAFLGTRAIALFSALIERIQFLGSILR